MIPSIEDFRLDESIATTFALPIVFRGETFTAERFFNAACVDMGDAGRVVSAGVADLIFDNLAYHKRKLSRAANDRLYDAVQAWATPVRDKLLADYRELFE